VILDFAQVLLDGINSLMRAYALDLMRSPFKADLMDFFKLTPSDFTVMVYIFEKPVVQLALLQGLSYQISRNVTPLTIVELPYFFPVSDGRILGTGQIQKIYTTPVGLPGLEENLRSVFEVWTKPEKLLDANFVLFLQEDTTKVELGMNVFNEYYYANIFEPKSFSYELQKYLNQIGDKILKNVQRAINALLPIFQEKPEFGLSYEALKEISDLPYLRGTPISYSFSMSAGGVACIEALSFLIVEVSDGRSESEMQMSDDDTGS